MAGYVVFEKTKSGVERYWTGEMKSLNEVEIAAVTKDVSAARKFGDADTAYRVASMHSQLHDYRVGKR